MKFSVIIPLYNKQNTIRRAIYSVLDQANIVDEDVQIIVIDDGSSDDSRERVHDIQQNNSGRNIKLIKQVNAGVSAARNNGVALAEHDFVAFLDADDSYTPTFLSQIKELKITFPDCHFFATSYYFVNQQSGTQTQAKVCSLLSKDKPQILTDFFLSAANGDLPFCASSFCIEKQLFNDINGFPVGENMGEDQSLYCQVALEHSLAYSPKPCANYFLEVTGSLMQTEKIINEMPYSQRLQTLLNQKKVTSAQEKSIKKYIAGHLFDLIRRNLNNHNTTAAIQQLNDSRIKLQSLKWLYWFSRATLAKLTLN